VLLSVTIDPQGLLKAIHVAQTSGYDVLDRSAVNTMREIKRLADAQPWLDGGDMEIELPVIYRLHD
jgi:TonB family protein